MKWKEEEINIGISLMKQRKTYAEIGVVLNKSDNSVRNKLNEFGFKFSDFKNEIRYCLNCNNTFEVFYRNDRKFCNSSCSATYNNKLKNPLRKCLNCGVIIYSQKKYCSRECVSDHNKKELFKKIELGFGTFSERRYKQYLINKYGNKCMECDWCEIHPTTGNVPIQLEHIDGNSDNNSLNNLKLLCPNCHSLTPTYGYLNAGNGRETKRNKQRIEWRKSIS